MSTTTEPDRLIVFDTTLRDGEQSPGASMTAEEKLRIAKMLERMRVDVIEAGFPAASPGDFSSVKGIADAVTDSTVCGLARALDRDIEACGDALKGAERGRIHTFIATSPLHMREKLHMSPDQVVEKAVQAVKKARHYTGDVEFSPEDAGRSELDFLCRVIEAVIDAGASTINIPDTVGYNLPIQFGALIANIRGRVPNADQAVFSVHCHNDLGLAVANSLAAVQNGARQVECTINGLGERAGNAALEEVVMAIKTRRDLFSCDSRVDTTQIVAASRLVASITGFPVQPNKAIVGANAFAHESGIHQDGVLKKRETYEIMRAEDVGWSKNLMVLGKHSGRNAFRTRLAEIGIDLDSETELNAAFTRFKELADRKHQIFDDDLQAIVLESQSVIDRYCLVSLSARTETGERPQVTITVGMHDDVGAETEKTLVGTGAGMVDAVFRAIASLMPVEPLVQLYSVNSITKGTDAQGEVTVRLEHADMLVQGQGSDTDIIVASAKAYINALNRLHLYTRRQHPQI